MQKNGGKNGVGDWPNGRLQYCRHPEIQMSNKLTDKLDFRLVRNRIKRPPRQSIN